MILKEIERNRRKFGITKAIIYARTSNFENFAILPFFKKKGSFLGNRER